MLSAAYRWREESPFHFWSEQSVIFWLLEIGWTDVGSGGYILVSCAHSNTSFIWTLKLIMWDFCIHRYSSLFIVYGLLNSPKMGSKSFKWNIIESIPNRYFNRMSTKLSYRNWGCRGRDGMVVGLITTYAISAYHH